MTKKPKKDFVLSLDENAMDSLIHAVSHFLGEKQTDLKYTILHVFHAVELYLKARLAKEHHSLIFDKPEHAASVDPKTVSFDVLVARLKAVGVMLSEDDLKDLTFLRKVRNSIEHHKYEGQKEAVKEYVGKAMRFLEAFLEKELDIHLNNALDEKIYRPLAEALYSYEERLEKAKEELEDALPSDKDRFEHSIGECPDCGEKTIAFPDPTQDDKNKARCYFCGEVYFASQCQWCHEPIFSGNEFSEDNPEIHEDCIYKAMG